MKSILLLLFLLCISFGTVTAQDSNRNVSQSIETPGQGAFDDAVKRSPPIDEFHGRLIKEDSAKLSKRQEDSTTSKSLLTSFEFALGIALLIFGLIVLCVELHLINQKIITGEAALRFIIVTLIVISSLFLIAVGYSNDQIAPVIGLLGSIAGYMLGKGATAQSTSPPSTDASSPTTNNSSQGSPASTGGTQTTPNNP